MTESTERILAALNWTRNPANMAEVKSYQEYFKHHQPLSQEESTLMCAVAQRTLRFFCGCEIVLEPWDEPHTMEDWMKIIPHREDCPERHG